MRHDLSRVVLILGDIELEVNSSSHFTLHLQRDLTMKNALALIGLAVLAKKGYEFFCHYRNLKQENAFLRRQSGAPDAGLGASAQPAPEGT